MILARLFRFILFGTIFFTPLIFWPDLFLTFELPKVMFFRIMTFILLFLLLVKFFLDEKTTFPRVPKIFWIAFGILILSFILATFFSVAPSVSFWGSYFRQQGFLTHVFFWLFTAVILIFCDKWSVYGLFRVLMWSAFLVAVLGIFQRFLPSFSFFWDVDSFLGRVFSTMGHPNYLATFLITIFPLYLVQIFGGQNLNREFDGRMSSNFFLKFFTKFFPGRENLSRIFWIFAAIVILTALFLTLGRAAVLGLFVSSALFFLIWLRRSGQKKMFAIFLTFLLVAPFLFVGLIKIAPKLPFKIPLVQRFVLEGENARSVSTRIVMWPAVLRQMRDRPVFGYGPETFPIAFPKYAPKELLTLENFQQSADRAHNEFLDMMVSNGSIGFISWIFFLVVILSIGFRSRDFHSVAASSGIIGLLTANQFGFSTTVHLMVFWLFVAAILLLNFPKKTVALPLFRKMYFSLSVLVFSGIAVIFLSWTLHIRPLLADRYFRLAQDSAREGDALSALNFTAASVSAFPYQSFYGISGSRVLLSFAEQIDSPVVKPFLNLTSQMLNRVYLLSNGHDPEYFLWRGVMLRLEKKFDESLVEFEKAYTLAPTSPLLFLEWGRAFAAAARYGEAFQKYEQYLDLAPNYWQWKGRKDLTPAEQNQYRIFYKLNPEFDAVFSLILDAAKKGGISQKIEQYQRFVSS